MKKRIVSLLVCLCLTMAMASALSLSALASTNGHTQAEAVAWINKQIGEYLDYDGAYGAQCVDLIKYYYAYLGNGKYATGNATNYQSNTLPSGWKRVTSNPKPGDVIVWGGGTKGGPGWTVSEYGHVGLVVAVDGNKLTTVEQNINGSPCKKTTRTASYATCFIRPDFSDEKILTISLNTNGGTLNSTEYKATAAGIIQKDGADVTHKWPYGSGNTKTGLANASTFGLTRSGYTFVGWSLSKDGTSTIFDQDDTTLKAETIYPNIKNGSASITLYAVWQPAEKILTISLNTNGGTLNSDEYVATSAGIIQKDGTNVTHKWPYGSGNTKTGLANASTFGMTRSGYTFVGWSLSKDGTSTIFDQDDTTLKAETIYPDVKNGSASITLYAIWKPEEVNSCADGHTWDSGVVTREPTSSSTGVRTYTCTVCGETKTEEIPAIIGASGLENYVENNYYYTGMFRDVSSSDWFSDNVAMSYRLGLMKGTGDGIFEPGKNISIAETITLAARLHKIYYTGNDKFDTYDGGSWYDPYVDYARNNGIISANYNYSQPATRELFVHILAQALPSEALEPIKSAISFADSGSITYKSDVELLSRAGIIAGVGVGNSLYFYPNNTITRMEVAAIVTRMAKTELRVP